MLLPDVDTLESTRVVDVAGVSITLGGLRVEEGSNRVLTEAGQPIQGLYAAGRTAVGVASNFYVSGLSIADCLWSGRRAALHAIQKTDNTAAQAA